MKHKWIQDAFPRKSKGALHKQLGIPQSKTIPKNLMRDLYHAEVGSRVQGHTVTTLLKRRVVAAVNAQKRRR